MPFGPFVPVLASLAFGFIKGLTSGVSESERAFSLEQDFLGPVKEEVIYRGVPLWVRPTLPFGSTAAIFAADHILSDHREAVKHNLAPPTAMQVLARLGDTFAGGCLYEYAARGPGGILGAVASHMAHNLAISWGARMRR